MPDTQRPRDDADDRLRDNRADDPLGKDADDRLRDDRTDDRRRDEQVEGVDDVGRTTGGGSLGHDQPRDVKREAPLRNATGSDRDPVMPQDDATLKTKI